MKRDIPCLCENTFTVEVPEEINLDEQLLYLDAILDGTFMSFVCSICGKTHKPEFPVKVLWPSRNLVMEVLPQEERAFFFRRKKKNRKADEAETVIGYDELADRLAVIRDGLEPVVIEALKYYFHLKAGEFCPDTETGVRYRRKNAGGLEFHLYGLRRDSVAITNVPLEMYEKTLAEFKRRPKGEPFASLRFGSCLSAQNMMLPEGIK
ncbi:MAG: CpXC domain-containing protein [Treponema sp.]|nr:CpXC domain-containing protein [Treponema sp.]